MAVTEAGRIAYGFYQTMVADERHVEVADDCEAGQRQSAHDLFAGRFLPPIRKRLSDPVKEALAFEAALVSHLANQLAFFADTTLDMATLFELYSGLGKYGGKRRLPEALDPLCDEYGWRWEGFGYGTFTIYTKTDEPNPGPAPPGVPPRH